uniref:Retinoic acid receptor responder 1 n=1 Tax=Athene cunicularia TaxID=194338 RepID=A0A663MDQ1_ATHCN
MLNSSGPKHSPGGHHCKTCARPSPEQPITPGYPPAVLCLRWGSVPEEVALFHLRQPSAPQRDSAAGQSQCHSVVLIIHSGLLLRPHENAGSCLATVLYRRTKSPPVVNIKCMQTKDQKQIQEEDNRLYQKIRHQTKPIIGNNIPDSYGHIEPALEPAWALAVTGSSYMMWEKSTESLGYFLAQVKSVKQWVNDFIEFDYTVLLHEVPTQEIISCHMRLTWLPGHPLKVKYFCASENQGLEDGSGMESGSAAGILHGRGANF